MPKELKYINVSEIIEPEKSLRKVDRSSEAYLDLVESVKLHGVIDSISVREFEDDDGKIVYGLINGLHRLSAAKDVGLDTVPCQVIDCAEAEVLESQIISNVHKVETKPVEYSKCILQIIEGNPLMSREELATKLAKTASWLSERLGLLKLTDEIGKFVDGGEIKLSNAYALAKLPQEEQADFVDRAMTMPPQQFTPTVNARVKELRDAKRKGKDASPEEFQPVPMLRGRSDIVNELENHGDEARLIGDCGSIEAAFQMALKWVLSIDPQSADLQQAKDEERKAERKRQSEKSTAERTRKRAEKAAKRAVELDEEADKLEAEEAKEAQTV